MADVVLAYKISKNAMKLVNAGEAVISSGGVRTTTGKLIELAKPATKLAGNSGVLSPLTCVSSLTNNVQSIFIQKGVNKANRGIKYLKKQGVEILDEIGLVRADTLEIKQGMVSMMDELYDVNRNVDLLNMKADFNLMQMNRLQNMVRGLSTVTWLSCAFSVLNVGISIAGFSQVLSTLSSISQQISALENKINRNVLNDYRQQFNKHYAQIKTDIQSLQNYEQKPSEMHFIPEHLNSACAFLERINNEFLEGNIDNELACIILFGLTNPFAQEVQFYSARYLYEKGELPAAYDTWMKVIASTGQKDFLSKLETALSLSHMELTFKQQKDIIDASAMSTRLQLDNMVFSNLLTDKIPEMDYLNFDQYLSRAAASAENCQEIEDGALLLIA